MRGERPETADDDPSAAAQVAGLRYVSDSEPGLTRSRHGRGFAYRDARGRTVSARRRRRITDLAIPPAWTGVWICARADGHLQATGFDDRGRKQYLYHDRWRRARSQATFDRLALMGAVLPTVRKAVDAQLRRRKLDRDRVLAGMVRMLDLTGIRAGNEAYERENRTVGLTTLRWSNLSFSDHAATVRYRAKSGIRAQLTIRDRPLLRLLRQLESSPRRRVFRVDGTTLNAGDLNGYLAGIADAHITAKDFRTWRGTVSALRLLLAEPPDKPPTRSRAIAAIDAAAADLRNTRSVARAHYVHPAVIERYLAGDLPPPAAPVPGFDEVALVLLAVLSAGAS